MRADPRPTLLGAALVLSSVSSLWLAPAAAASDGPARLPASREYVVADPTLDEISGMVASQLHDGVSYVVEDSKNGPHVYAIGPDGQTVATFTLNGAVNVDWEAMAPGTDDHGNPVLWIGDIGDNDSQRDSIRLYRVDEPVDLVDGSLGWTKVDLTYPDRAHNAEALLSDPKTGQLFVVTKEALGAGVYAAPVDLARGNTYQLTRIADAPMFVTDGAISPDGSLTVLRTYGDAVFVDGPAGPELAHFMLPPQPQGETLAFTPDGSALLVGSEGAQQPVYRVQLPAEVPASGSPSEAAPTGTSQAAAPTSTSAGASTALALGLGVVVLLGLFVGALMTLGRREETTTGP
ncbi:MAG: hypothetical protein WAN48_09475 [Actinomycetes bacterium]